MKRNTKRMLSMLLALVMLLSAVPFVGAADADKTVWPGTLLDLYLDLDAGYTADNVVWTLPDGSMENADTVSYIFTEGGSAKVSYTLTAPDGSSTQKNETYTVAMKTPAKSGTFAISGADTAVVGSAVQLTATGANDSAVQWSVEDGDATVSSTGSFKASKGGTYVVKAIATNNPDDDSDDVQAVKQIVVSTSEYTVSVADKTIDIDATNSYLNYSIKDKDNKTVTSYTSLKFTSSNTAVVAVNASTSLLTPKKEGSATITMTVVINGNTYTDTATVKVEDGNGLISMDQDGESTDDDSIELEFEVVGPEKKDDVEWTFDVTVLGAKDSKTSPWFIWVDGGNNYDLNTNDKREMDVEEEGPSVEVELQAKKGYGVAVIDAYASWGNSDDEEAKGTFYVAFYDEIDYTLTLKDDVDEFDFDDEDVFKLAKKGTTSLTASTTNIANLLDDDTDGYVLLDEGKKASKNEDVGEISTNSSKAPDYDPDDENEFEMGDLKYLTFEADDEGSFILEYIQYQKVGRYNDYLITGEGTIEIIVGEGTGSSKEGDINYDVKNKGDVTLDEDDFEDFWDDYCDDEDISGTNAEFGYVIFDYNSSKINGAMYAEDGDKNMKDTYKFHFDYDDDEDDSSKDFDLTEVVYEASSSKTNYVDEIDFTCYSDNGKEEVDGTITFTVGEGEEEKEEETTTTTGTMNFTDVRTTDWYYSSVLYVYNNQIMAGTSNTKFDPNTNLSRAMVVTMLYRAAGEPTVTASSKFSDVKDTSSWYYKAVCWAAQNEIVNGVTATTFAPNTNITREQLAAILYRYAGYKGQSTAATTPLTGYADASSVSSYATTAMKWAVGSGIITGDAGRLMPQGNATRAQAAAMFERFLSK